MHVTKQGRERKKRGGKKKTTKKKKPAAYSHKVATQLQLYEKQEQGFHQSTDSPEARWTLNMFECIYIYFQSMKEQLQPFSLLAHKYTHSEELQQWILKVKNEQVNCDKLILLFWFV